MITHAGLDFETFCSVDISKHGGSRYFEGPDFQVLLACIAYKGGRKEVFDFVAEPDAKERLFEALDNIDLLSAHNASFERACCKWLGYGFDDDKFVDSAVTSRAWGAGSHLAAAAPQLLGQSKIELGANLIQVFSVPTKANGGKPYTWQQIDADAELTAKWTDYVFYCCVDAELSLTINTQHMPSLPPKEQEFELLTQRMNDAGWFVDMPLVHEMNERYHENLDALEAAFRSRYDPKGELNFRSYVQLQKWCALRGVKTKSFDQQAIPKLIRQVKNKMVTVGLVTTYNKYNKYNEVLALLTLKQEMGGSSLSKLQTIIDMVGADNRLRGQYMHIGAGQSYRTSGRGVQLQNLARLAEKIGDMDELLQTWPESGGRVIHWDNDKLAHNIRQVFKAEDPNGEEIVGDFKSVESRGLAYLAGEEWKLEAYRQKKDIYKMLAMTYQSNAGTTYDNVTKTQRQGGKVGELACGYGAGAGAIKSFAEKMGIDMDETEAASIQRDWREANPEIVKFWKILDTMLHNVMLGKYNQQHNLPYGGSIEISQTVTPDSLKAQHPGSQSIELRVYTPSDGLWMTRVFHGCYFRGNDICYYKPSELKGGDLWSARMKTPPHAWFKLYGGKLAGILTQSFCRELFFQSMYQLAADIKDVPNVKMIGQFHDELVLEWTPITSYNGRGLNEAMRLDQTIATMETAMSNAHPWTGFPLEADVKHAHRYIK